MLRKVQQKAEVHTDIDQATSNTNATTPPAAHLQSEYLCLYKRSPYKTYKCM